MFAGRAELAVLFLVGASFFIYLFFWRVMLGNTLRFLFGMYGVDNTLLGTCSCLVIFILKVMV
jgi:hypothetical protein